MTSHLAWVDCDRGDWEQNLRNPVKCPLLHQLSSIPSKLLVISIADRFFFFPARENLLQEEKSHVETFSNPLQKVDESVRVTLVTNPNVVKALITQTVRTTEYVLYIHMYVSYRVHMLLPKTFLFTANPLFPHLPQDL